MACGNNEVRAVMFVAFAAIFKVGWRKTSLPVTFDGLGVIFLWQDVTHRRRPFESFLSNFILAFSCIVLTHGSAG